MTTEYHHYEFNETMLEKRQRLLDAGVQPYPYSFEGGRPIGDVVADALAREEAGGELEFAATVAGRIWAIRKMGKSTFVDLRDGSGKIQLYVHKSVNGSEACVDFGDLDLGDIVGVSGSVFRTRTGELSIKVESAVVLAKVVVPIPMGKEAEGHAFSRAVDPEIQYRERYVHWMLDDVDRERMRKRSAIISAVRRRMEADGFLEVQTPTIEFVYGGAEARPFATEIWALGHREAFLRISPELYLKRYIVAGFEKVYTICQNFRNEGIDRSHNPEFTMMEWYEAYTDYATQMQRFETLVAGVVEEITGGLTVTYQGTEIDFTTPWRRVTMLDALTDKGIDADAMSLEQLREEMTKRDIKHDPSIPWGLAVAELFEATCEDDLVQPTFVIDHPKDISPLTKTKRGDDRLVERFEPYVCRMELGNAYSELTDPVDQLDRLLAQRDVKREGEEADVHHHPVDADFVKAIGCGMPPTGGVGIGIDRLIMLLTDAATIRDIIPFPMIKPKADQG